MTIVIYLYRIFYLQSILYA